MQTGVDGTIRVYNCQDFQALVEFSCSRNPNAHPSTGAFHDEDVPLSVGYDATGNNIACGFVSGALRMFGAFPFFHVDFRSFFFLSKSALISCLQIFANFRS
jgi:hypothetical protein